MSKIALTIIASIIASNTTIAAPPAPEELTITASRWADQNDVLNLPGATSIDRDTIESSVSQDVLDLLRRQAGIDLTRSGGPGGQTSVFMRGSNSNHVLVLIDGIRVAAAGTGAFQWENLPLEQLERIDIVRGPRASFYGSDAIGGIINIVTRRSDGHSARLEAGSDNSLRGELSIAGGDANMRYWTTFAHRQTDGFDATTADNFFNNPDDDGFDQYSLNAGISSQIGDRHQLRASLLSRDAEVEFDQGESENRSHQLALRLSGQLSDQLEHAAQLGVVDDVLETPAFSSRFDTRRYELDWQLNYGRGSTSAWTFGLSAVDENGQSANEFDIDRDNQAVFAGWDFGTDKNRWQVSARYDDNGSKTTGRIGWQLTLTPRWTMHASHGTAFRLANFNELFSPGFAFGVDPDTSNPIVLFAGNPDLAPEQSSSSELGFALNAGNHALTISAYTTDIDDLIAFQGPDSSATNIGRADIDGVELDYTMRRANWTLSSNASWLDARDGADQQLLRRAERKASLSVQRRWHRTELGAELVHSGDRPDFGGATLDAYNLINLRGSYQLTPNWAVTARMENVSDEDYQLAAGFTSAGRGTWLGLRWAQNP